ncbi:maltokinase N-terminal cap-like domain-containing protein [Streptomyces milbemycinicus]|uniref:Maltokinase N-terminal cap domain-containing protein n=1 Tax=Streptomyces milbemycinicus TaxID=476552 RepID=A0ABW8M542_9ACTN
MTALPLSVAAMLRSTEVGRGLATWLPKQRWFAGGSAPLTEVSVHGVHRFASSAPDAASTGAFVLVRARDGGGADEATYLVPLGVRDAAGAPAGDGVVAHVGALAVYDALDDPALVNALIRHTVQGRAMDGVRYRPESGVGAPPGTDLAVRPLGTEQSNSSVVAGEEYILKLFRRPGSGPSTDLTVHRTSRHCWGRWRTQQQAPPSPPSSGTCRTRRTVGLSQWRPRRATAIPRTGTSRSRYDTSERRSRPSTATWPGRAAGWSWGRTTTCGCPRGSCGGWSGP